MTDLYAAWKFHHTVPRNPNNYNNYILISIELYFVLLFHLDFVHYKNNPGDD